MNLKSVETTPNPNSMKLNLDVALGAPVTYSDRAQDGLPPFVEQLLSIAGVKSVFVCNDFITINRDPRSDWQPILASAAAVFSDGDTSGATEDGSKAARDAFEKEGQVHVLVQTFKGIPIQVKVADSQGETRLSLGERFNSIAQNIQDQCGADFLKERYWADHGVRYGDRDAIAREVLSELDGTFDDDALVRARNRALGLDHDSKISNETIKQWLGDADWHRRLAAVQELSLHEDNVQLLAVSLQDENPQVRRLAAAALGTTGSTEAIKPLCQALLNDNSVGVRRTAGDALSDIGDPAVEPEMCRALKDANKLVRWRAARFLFDLGSKDALSALSEGVDDPEFEVRLEVEAAIQRIESGGSGIGPAWKRIVSL